MSERGRTTAPSRATFLMKFQFILVHERERKKVHVGMQITFPIPILCAALRSIIPLLSTPTYN